MQVNDYKGRRVLEHEPTVGFRFIPDIKARIPHEGGGYLIRTNSAGFRCDHEPRATKPKGTRRILLFGDSFTAGDGVSNGRRYGDVLEELIPSLETLNFGLPGTGTDQQYLAYGKYASDLDSDLLVIGVLVENIRRIVARYRTYADQNGNNVIYAKPYYELEGDHLTLHNVPVSKHGIAESELPVSERGAVDQGGRFRRLRALATRIDAREAAQRLTRYQPVPEYGEPNHPGWLLMRAILGQWIESHPGPVLVMPIPLYQFVEGSSNPMSYQARFRELAASTGCILHDPLADLAAYPREERRSFRFKSDVHLTPAGHVALARSLAPAVERVLNTDPIHGGGP